MHSNSMIFALHRSMQAGNVCLDNPGQSLPHRLAGRKLMSIPIAVANLCTYFLNYICYKTDRWTRFASRSCDAHCSDGVDVQVHMYALQCRERMQSRNGVECLQGDRLHWVQQSACREWSTAMSLLSLECLAIPSLATDWFKDSIFVELVSNNIVCCISTMAHEPKCAMPNQVNRTFIV